MYVYVVQDHDHEIRAVRSTLQLARDTFSDLTTEMMTSDVFVEYQQLVENGEADLWGPWILVQEIDGGCIWSYETIEEIDDALANGGQYDD